MLEREVLVKALLPGPPLELLVKRSGTKRTYTSHYLELADGRGFVPLEKLPADAYFQAKTGTYLVAVLPEALECNFQQRKGAAGRSPIRAFQNLSALLSASGTLPGRRWFSAAAAAEALGSQGGSPGDDAWDWGAFDEECMSYERNDGVPPPANVESERCVARENWKKRGESLIEKHEAGPAPADAPSPGGHTALLRSQVAVLVREKLRHQGLAATLCAATRDLEERIETAANRRGQRRGAGRFCSSRAERATQI